LKSQDNNKFHMHIIFSQLWRICNPLIRLKAFCLHLCGHWMLWTKYKFNF